MNLPPVKHSVGRPLLVLAALAACAVSGCGSSQGRITGVVKYNGRPLPLGSIAFLVQGGDNQVAHAEIVDGKYSIPSLPFGPSKVAVTAAALPNNPGAVPSGSSAPPPPDPRKYVQISARYSNPDRSGLTYDVQRGSQIKNFDLTP